jgi:hypothetical protein
MLEYLLFVVHQFSIGISYSNVHDRMIDHTHAHQSGHRIAWQCEPFLCSLLIRQSNWEEFQIRMLRWRKAFPNSSSVVQINYRFWLNSEGIFMLCLWTWWATIAGTRLWITCSSSNTRSPRTNMASCRKRNRFSNCKKIDLFSWQSCILNLMLTSWCSYIASSSLYFPMSWSHKQLSTETVTSSMRVARQWRDIIHGLIKL